MVTFGIDKKFVIYMFGGFINNKFQLSNDIYKITPCSKRKYNFDMIQLELLL